MHISPKLADLNKDRFQKWRMEHDQQNSKQAILAFKGDVYEGLKAWEFKKSDFTFAQKHLAGAFRPLWDTQTARFNSALPAGNGHRVP